MRLSTAKKVWKGLLSPRLELGISRVSGGRINQLSHESAFSIKSAAYFETPRLFVPALFRCLHLGAWSSTARSSNTIASIADKSMICLDAHRSAVQRSTHIARPGVRVSPFCAHHKLRRTDGDASSMLASTHSAGFLHVGGTPLPTKAMRVQSAQNRRYSSCTVMLSLAARV